jgi:hypothetical protein
MTAIATGGRRDTKKEGEALSPQRIGMAVTAAKTLKPGGLVCMITAGTCEPGKTGTGLVALGVCYDAVDNSGSLSPAPVATIHTGQFEFENSANSDLIAAANIGQTVYMVDDQTVALTDGGGTRSPAGTLVDMSDAGKPVVAVSPLLPISAHGFALQSVTKEIVAGVDTLAGQGTGADTNGTARVYNLGSALPAGAVLMGFIIHLKTTFSGNTTLVAKVGTSTDDDAITTTANMMATAGYTQGTVGDDYVGLMPVDTQLVLTLTPDGGSKVSAAAAGDAKVTVWYVDGTDH